MTEREPWPERVESRNKAGVASLAAAAAELMRRTIEKTDPAQMDFKDIKQLTGALKDLSELMGGAESGGEDAIVIRIEGDRPP